MNKNRHSPPSWVHGLVGEAAQTSESPFSATTGPRERNSACFLNALSQKIFSKEKLSWNLSREPKGEWKLTRKGAGEGEGEDHVMWNVIKCMWCGPESRPGWLQYPPGCSWYRVNLGCVCVCVRARAHVHACVRGCRPIFIFKKNGKSVK